MSDWEDVPQEASAPSNGGWEDVPTTPTAPVTAPSPTPAPVHKRPPTELEKFKAGPPTPPQLGVPLENIKEFGKAALSSTTGALDIPFELAGGVANLIGGKRALGPAATHPLETLQKKLGLEESKDRQFAIQHAGGHIAGMFTGGVVGGARRGAEFLTSSISNSISPTSRALGQLAERHGIKIMVGHKMPKNNVSSDIMKGLEGSMGHQAELNQNALEGTLIKQFGIPMKGKPGFERINTDMMDIASANRKGLFSRAEELSKDPVTGKTKIWVNDKALNRLKDISERLKDRFPTDENARLKDLLSDLGEPFPHEKFTFYPWTASQYQEKMTEMNKLIGKAYARGDNRLAKDLEGVKDEIDSSIDIFLPPEARFYWDKAKQSFKMEKILEEAGVDRAGLDTANFAKIMKKRMGDHAWLHYKGGDPVKDMAKLADEFPDAFANSKSATQPHDVLSLVRRGTRGLVGATAGQLTKLPLTRPLTPASEKVQEFLSRLPETQAQKNRGAREKLMRYLGIK